MRTVENSRNAPGMHKRCDSEEAHEEHIWHDGRTDWYCRGFLANMLLGIQGIMDRIDQLDRQETEIRAPYAGMLIYGYCNGYFGRDSYDTKIIREIGIIGDEVYVVAENSRRQPVFASGMSMDDVARWGSEQERLHWSE